MLVLSVLSNLPKGQVELKFGQGKQKTHLPTGQVHFKFFSLALIISMNKEQSLKCSCLKQQSRFSVCTIENREVFFKGSCFEKEWIPVFPFIVQYLNFSQAILT